MKQGAQVVGDQILFRVWAPLKNRMLLHLVHPIDAVHEMKRAGDEYWEIRLGNAGGDFRYYFRPDGEADYPDPASFHQPEGVHGPSQTLDHGKFVWEDEHWKGVELREMILYELHVGTFTREGSFDAVIPRIPALLDLGVNAIELMPVAQFPGNRNWGYDGVFPYAVQHSYGGPEGLKKLVNACHRQGMAVVLDVVYNHFGPEGNCAPAFGPFQTDRYRTPWGQSINFDGAWSDGVRAYFEENAVYWFEQYHLDALRCDAIHEMYDFGAVHFWEQTQRRLRALRKKLRRPLALIAESDLNDPRVLRAPARGGYGFQAQWLDDFQHAAYVRLNPEDGRRYEDFLAPGSLAKAFRDGFVHSGEWVRFRKKKFGRSSRGIPADRFVVFLQNHDQVGNRVGGERLAKLVSPERQQLGAALMILSPYIPLFFMGEEYGEDNPFHYFVSHTDPELIQAVREGRKKDFSAFAVEEDDFPDPQGEASFRDSMLSWEKRTQGKHGRMLHWYKTLIHIRKAFPAFRTADKNNLEVRELGEAGLLLLRKSATGDQIVLCLFNFSLEPLSVQMPGSGFAKYRLPWSWTHWTRLLDSAAGSPATEKEHPPRLPANALLELQPESVLVYLAEEISPDT